MYQRLSIFFVSIIILAGCNKEKQQNDLVNVIIKDTMVTVYPEIVLVGSHIKFNVKIKDSVYIVRNIYINDSCVAHFDSSDNTSSFFTIPFGTNTGTISFYINNTKLQGPKILMTEYYNPLTINLDWYNIAEPLLLKDTCNYNFDNSPALWECEIRHDTIILINSYGPNGFFGITRKLTFTDMGANKIPKFVSYIRTISDDVGQSFSDSISKGFIKFQKWDRNSTVFGKYFYSFSENGRWYSEDFVFYFKFK